MTTAAIPIARHGAAAFAASIQAQPAIDTGNRKNPAKSHRNGMIWARLSAA